MKQASLVFNVVLLILVAILFYLHFANHQPANINQQVNRADTNHQALKLAYVNVDSLQAHYEYFKTQKDQLEKSQQAMDNELNADAGNLQKEYAQFQQKAATMTQSEGEAAQQKLMQEQQQLQQKKQNMQQQLMDQQAKFQDALQKRVDNFLKKYNTDHHYTFIFSYSSALPEILYKDSTYNITEDVIEGLNLEEKNEKE